MEEVSKFVGVLPLLFQPWPLVLKCGLEITGSFPDLNIEEQPCWVVKTAPAVFAKN